MGEIHQNIQGTNTVETARVIVSRADSVPSVPRQEPAMSARDPRKQTKPRDELELPGPEGKEPIIRVKWSNPVGVECEIRIEDGVADTFMEMGLWEEITRNARVITVVPEPNP